MTDNSFDNFVRELEARANDVELANLASARERARAELASVERQIVRRERIDAFVAKMNDIYEVSSVTLHPWPLSPFNHDGPCVEIAPRYCGGMRFTTLLLKGEIWGEHGNGERVTDDPVYVSGSTDDEIIANFVEYIDGWIAHHTGD